MVFFLEKQIRIWSILIILFLMSVISLTSSFDKINHGTTTESMSFQLSKETGLGIYSLVLHGFSLTQNSINTSSFCDCNFNSGLGIRLYYFPLTSFSPNQFSKYSCVLGYGWLFTQVSYRYKKAVSYALPISFDINKKVYSAILFLDKKEAIYSLAIKRRVESDKEEVYYFSQIDSSLEEDTPDLLVGGIPFIWRQSISELEKSLNWLKDSRKVWEGALEKPLKDLTKLIVLSAV